MRQDDKNELLNKKKTIKNNTKQKKLKNVITSIQYRNNKSPIRNNNELKDKNIILSEYDKNGKINIKVKKLNKSIEKILRENSTQKARTIYYLKSPIFQGDVLTYVKKNQGTHISKNKFQNFE